MRQIKIEVDIKSKISDVSGLQMFQLIRYAALLLVGVLLAKSGLSSDEIGQYETFLLVGGFFSFFWVNGLIKALLPLSADESINQKSLLFNAFLLLLGSAVLSALVYLIFSKPVSVLLLNGGNIISKGLLAAYLILNSPGLLVEYVYLIRKQSVRIPIYGIIIFGIHLAAVGIPPLLGFPIIYSIYGLIAVSLIKFIWIGVILWKQKCFVIDRELLKKFGHLGIPLIASTLLSSSAQYIDGFIITSNYGPADLAIFRYGARELPLSMILANTLSVAMISRFNTNDFKSPLAELRSEIYRLGNLLFPLTIVLLCTSHLLFPIVFSAGFKQSATIFNIYLLLIISRLAIPQTILTGKGLNNILVWASTFEIIVNVTSSVVLALFFGIEGVAYGTIIACIFEKCYLGYRLKKELNIVPSQYIPMKQYLSYSAIVAVIFIIVEFIIY